MSLLNFLKQFFDHILVLDFEFKQDPGQNPKLVCLTIKDLITEKIIDQWLVNRKPRFPFPLARSLLIGHYISAEVGCLLQLGYGCPKYCIDTFVEEKKFYNGLRNNGYGLIDSCKRYNIKTISHEIKDAKRDVIIENYPNYTPEQIEEIKKYNLSDVEINEKLFLAQLNKVEGTTNNFKEWTSQAIFHGRSMGICAKIQRNGIPINMKLHRDLVDNYEAVRTLEMQELNEKCGVEIYANGVEKRKNFEELLKKEKIYDRWPKTATGKCKTDDKTLYRWQNVNEKILFYRNSKFIIDAKKLKGVCLGPDDRSRCDLSMFGQITGRTNVSTKLNPFGAPRRMRNLIGTDKNHYIIYADWKSQEAAIQAALSKDPQMVRAVKSGDPYMWTAIRLEAVPPGSKKKTHPKIREIYKQTFLATAYRQTPIGLNAKLENSMSEAYFIHGQLENLYREYFKWNDGVIHEGTLRGYFKTKFGWQYHLTANDVVNPRTLANWPLQSQGSEILRRALIDLDEAGFEISMPIHDAVLIHMKRKDWKEMRSEIRKIKSIMSSAAVQVINWNIPVDIKIIKDQFRQDKEHQKLWDELYGKVLKVKRGVRNSDSLSVYRTGLSGNQTTVSSN
jgi:DNA polymerase I-like protein with 3'-5' exonuclease and polymerase domains